MKHTRRLLSVVALFLLCPLVARAALESDVAAVLRDKLLAKASVGIHIVQLDAEPGRAKDLFVHNGQMPLMPASNMKVLTTSAALDHFGADFKLRTLLLARGQDLILVGDGDPTFGDAELLKKSGWTVTTAYENWAQQLKKAGLQSFQNVLVDDSIFDEVLAQPNWDPKQLHSRYAAQTAGMTLNVGCIDFYVHNVGGGKTVSYATHPPTQYVTVHNTCVGGGENAIILDRSKETNNIVLKGTCRSSTEVPVSITINDPALYAATVLAETFKANGISISGTVSRDRSIRAAIAGAQLPADYKVLAVHETPIIQVISRANKDSMNLYAESLCKRLGAAVSGESGSWENGTAAVGAFLKKVGADPKEFHLDDGCGLSRQNTVSADAMIRVLAYNYFSKQKDAFIGSLAVAGHDGTLDERFKGSDLRGRVFAKSGFINNVSALSGYLKAKDDHWYAFSILMNGLPRGTNSRAKELQEKVVKAIDLNTHRTGR